MSSNPNSSVKFCPSCGAEPDEASTFCHECGKDLSNVGKRKIDPDVPKRSGLRIGPLEVILGCVVVGLAAVLVWLLVGDSKLNARPTVVSTQPAAPPMENAQSAPAARDSAPTSPALTSDSAQRAIDRFKSANGFSGSMTVRGGIREIPADNSATADLTMSNFTNGGDICPGKCAGWSAGGEWNTGKAVFSHFTDGKWELSSVSITHSGHGQIKTFKTTIEAR